METALSAEWMVSRNHKRGEVGGVSESAPPQELLYGNDSSAIAKKVRRKFKKLNFPP